MTLVSETRRRENDAEHSWHLAMMALLLEEYAVRPVDIAHVIKMSLVHDLVEIYAGDTFAYDIKGNIDKEERENKAADLLFSILPKDQEELMFSLWREFDAMQTDNSLFANALDRLQPFLSNVMTEGHTWKIGHVTKEKILWRMDPIRIATPALWQYLLDMIDELEKKGYISE